MGNPEKALPGLLMFLIKVLLKRGKIPNIQRLSTLALLCFSAALFINTKGWSFFDLLFFQLLFFHQKAILGSSA